MHVMERRVAAAQATFDAFQGKAFEWGRYDCVRLAAHCLRGLGHKPGLTRAGFYKSELGAFKALKRLGFEDLAQAVEALGLPRIAPAAALAGDILGFRHPTGHKLTALSVHLGNHRVLGFMQEDMICHAVTPTFGVDGADYLAWRAL